MNPNFLDRLLVFGTACGESRAPFLIVALYRSLATRKPSDQ
jgi:hypothetical protein